MMRFLSTLKHVVFLTSLFSLIGVFVLWSGKGIKANKYVPKGVDVDLEEFAKIGDETWKTIVAWNGVNGVARTWDKVFARLSFKECEENRCRVTSKKSEVSKADAVLFNVHDLEKFDDLRYAEDLIPSPKHRTSNQVYVFFSLEAPNENLKTKWSSYNNFFFNWTMTYRRDSDVVVPYGKVTTMASKRSVKYVTIEELQKKRVGLWMASHCVTASKRENLIESIQKHLPIHTYGACGNYKCGFPSFLIYVTDIESDKCLAMLPDHAFYFALENNLCKDYVTEKLYKALKLGVVPVVYGGLNYSSVAPPHSFIDSRDFDSDLDLVKHLQKVYADADLYNGYLKWQEDYEVELGSPYKPFICDLCKKLHKQTPETPKQMYRNIKHWFFNKAECKNPF